MRLGQCVRELSQTCSAPFVACARGRWQKITIDPGRRRIRHACPDTRTEMCRPSSPQPASCEIGVLTVFRCARGLVGFAMQSVYLSRFSLELEETSDVPV
jgi:hypothetical protein